MEKQYFKFDKDGYFIKPFIASEVWDDENPMPRYLTSIRPPDGLFRARFVDGAWIETGEPPQPDIETVRRNKIDALNEEAMRIITDGIEIETSQGTFHFRLDLHDQINLLGLSGDVTAAIAGLPSLVDISEGILYAPDKMNHVLWRIEDFNLIVAKLTMHKKTHLVHVRQMTTLVREAKTIEEIEKIVYGGALGG